MTLLVYINKEIILLTSQIKTFASTHIIQFFCISHVIWFIFNYFLCLINFYLVILIYWILRLRILQKLIH